MNHRPFSSQRYASRPLIRQVYRSPTPPAERQAARRTSRTASTGYLWPASNSTTRGVPSYVILTTAAIDSMRKIHDRMPLVLTREQILNAVWGYEYIGEDRTVDWQIKLLRGKLGDCRDIIKTMRGVGYKLEA